MSYSSPLFSITNTLRSTVLSSLPPILSSAKNYSTFCSSYSCSFSSSLFYSSFSCCFPFSFFCSIFSSSFYFYFISSSFSTFSSSFTSVSPLVSLLLLLLPSSHPLFFSLLPSYLLKLHQLLLQSIHQLQENLFTNYC